MGTFTSEDFAVGVNPYIHTPMKDTLFDEKIDGSFHFTPGSCDDCNNGNKSAIHWEFVDNPSCYPDNMGEKI
ncbi:MAG: hypothetical protein APF81_13505 [Desulfosporosinus sp. BRH_c37]|nr:MAG: hypothetical protein APF81_13505 [Desulfosporosinus sp. BRH_c37]